MDAIQKSGLLATEGIYRAAFPAFRIFVYGKEVSGDVIDVRVNQAGGSQDRAPGTCSFTLANKGDKYILDHNDMIALGTSRDALVKQLFSNYTAALDSGSQILSSAGLDTTVLAAFLQQYSSSPEKYAGITNDIQDIYNQLKMAGKYYQESWEEGKVPGYIKWDVLSVKATQISSNRQKIWDQCQRNKELAKVIFGPSNDDMDQGANNIQYVYQFQEGDCIFHPNDPIRIAFRDPFDPVVWYWMFAGFVDSATENVGVNQESTITITGTDVSKMLRYSYIQLYSVLDRETLTQVFPDLPIPGSASATAFSFTGQIFAGLTIFEVLEFLFFGLDAFKAALLTTTAELVSQLNPEELRTYLIQNAGQSSVDAMKDQSPPALRAEVVKFRNATLTKFANSNVPPVQTPQGVGFKRKDGSFGTHAYFVGDVKDPLDNYGDLITMDSLRTLNDVLHSRVRSSDLQDMVLPDHTVPASASSLYVPEQIITEIGTHPNTYPVGGGRVFYVTPATLGTEIEKGVLDSTANGSCASHSDFKDRLSFLYDLAEAIDFCCYATPKGDMVFEMPFFDFDPWMFDFKNKRPNSTVTQANVTSLLKEIQARQGRTSLTGYNDADIAVMMGLTSEAELLSAGFDLENTSKWHFSYLDHFTIWKHETLNYSNSMNDHGMLTAYRAMRHNVALQPGTDSDASRNYVYVAAPELASILGLRIADSNPWGFTDTDEAARLWAALNLKKANAEARNLSVQILPHFGLMVNRPIYWKQRNYLANIVSVQHAISWFSDCSTTINLNRARGWTGSMNPEKQEQFSHFSTTIDPFNLSQIVFRKKGS